MTTTSAPVPWDKKRDFSVLSWNTNFDARALTGPFSWEARRDAVVALIVKADADFVCLQELRDDAVRFLMAHPAITAKYDLSVARTNATDMALCLVTMWDKRRWTCAARPLWYLAVGEMYPQWADCCGNGFGRVALETEFYPAVVPDPKNRDIIRNAAQIVLNDPLSGQVYHPLIIYNVHFGLSEPERLLEAETIRRHVEVVREHAEVVVCGDFNTFPDAGGKEEVRVICSGGPGGPGVPLRNIVEYGEPIRTTIGSIAGTQVSYPYDTYVKYKGSDHEELHPVEDEMGGRLDHVFHTSGLTLIDNMLLTYRMDGTLPTAEDFGYHKADTAPRFPSDHFPWYVVFRLPSPGQWH
jgi:hypothetical protein